MYTKVCECELHFCFCEKTIKYYTEKDIIDGILTRKRKRTKYYSNLKIKREKLMVDKNTVNTTVFIKLEPFNKLECYEKLQDSPHED